MSTIRISGSESVLWFYFSYLFVVAYIFGGTLIANMVSVMNKQGRQMIMDIALANKSKLVKYANLSARQRLREYFKKLKKNTLGDGGADAAQAAGTALKRYSYYAHFMRTIVLFFSSLL